MNWKKNSQRRTHQPRKNKTLLTLDRDQMRDKGAEGGLISPRQFVLGIRIQEYNVERTHTNLGGWWLALDRENTLVKNHHPETGKNEMTVRKKYKKKNRFP